MLIGVMAQYVFGIAIFVTSVFLVMLVLVQRGRGGGLVGALGGPGGQSALGTKAGDIFTRITIVVAAIWIFLCAAAVRVLNPSDSSGLAELDEVADVRSGQMESQPGTIGTNPATTIPRDAAPGASDRAAPGESTPGSATVVPANPRPSTTAPATPPATAPAPATSAPTTPTAPVDSGAPENSLRPSKPAESAPPAEGQPPAPADKPEDAAAAEEKPSEPATEAADKSE
ncbi:MAG: preprotein translocase subunit SecG [Aureliella sp.]